MREEKIKLTVRVVHADDGRAIGWIPAVGRSPPIKFKISDYDDRPLVSTMIFKVIVDTKTSPHLRLVDPDSAHGLLLERTFFTNGRGETPSPLRLYFDGPADKKAVVFLKPNDPRYAAFRLNFGVTKEVITQTVEPVPLYRLMMEGVSAPSVPYAGISPLAHLVVTRGGDPIVGAEITIFVDSDSPTFSLIDTGSTRRLAVDIITRTTDEHGQTPPFQFSHNGGDATRSIGHLHLSSRRHGSSEQTIAVEVVTDVGSPRPRGALFPPLPVQVFGKTRWTRPGGVRKLVVVCEHCGAEYEVDPGRLGGSNLKATCIRGCHQLFHIHLPPLPGEIKLGTNPIPTGTIFDDPPTVVDPIDTEADPDDAVPEPRARRHHPITWLAAGVITLILGSAVLTPVASAPRPAAPELPPEINVVEAEDTGGDTLDAAVPTEPDVYLGPTEPPPVAVVPPRQGRPPKLKPSRPKPPRVQSVPLLPPTSYPLGSPAK